MNPIDDFNDGETTIFVECWKVYDFHAHTRFDVFPTTGGLSRLMSPTFANEDILRDCNLSKRNNFHELPQPVSSRRCPSCEDEIRCDAMRRCVPSI